MNKLLRETILIWLLMISLIAAATMLGAFLVKYEDHTEMQRMEEAEAK